MLNLVERAIQRRLPVVVVDGKGDHGLASKVVAHAQSCGRPAYLFSMTGDGCRYNPLAAGGYSAKKDRIIELREWSEDHYRKLAEGYLQTVFKVLAACDVPTDLAKLAGYLSTEKLLGLIRGNGAKLGNQAGSLIDEAEEQLEAEKHVEGVRAEIRNLAHSEVGHLFTTDADRRPTDSAGGAGDDLVIADVVQASSSVLEPPPALSSIFACQPCSFRH